MNYLSHFYMDIDHPDPYFQFGTILPDLIRSVDRKLRIPKSLLLTTDGNDNIQQLSLGCNRHFEVDDLFHNSNFFREHTSQIKTLLYERNLQNPKLKTHLLAHVLLELMLDRLLIKLDITICDRFYVCLKKVEYDNLNILLNKISYYDHQLLCDYLDRFQQSQYLYSYEFNDKIIFALNRIFSRVGITELLKPDEQRFLNFIEEIEVIIKKDFENMFTTLSKQIAKESPYLKTPH